MANHLVCHNGAQYSLERGQKYLNSFKTRITLDVPCKGTGTKIIQLKS